MQRVPQSFQSSMILGNCQCNYDSADWAMLPGFNDDSPRKKFYSEVYGFIELANFLTKSQTIAESRVKKTKARNASQGGHVEVRDKAISVLYKPHLHPQHRNT